MGNIIDIPFDEGTFDCVWSANVMQHLTESQFDRTISEMKRVVRPGGVITKKDFDDTLVQLLPVDPGVVSRFFELRRKSAQHNKLLGTTCGLSLPSRLRRAGLENIQRLGWLVERWAPVAIPTRRYAEAALSYWSELTAKLGAPESHLAAWREAAANPATLIDDPAFVSGKGLWWLLRAFRCSNVDLVRLRRGRRVRERSVHQCRPAAVGASMLTLYYFPGSYSIAASTLLEESGCGYQSELINLRQGQQRGEAYQKINPLRYVPALKIEDGQVIIENTAILPYLAKHFGM